MLGSHPRDRNHRDRHRVGDCPQPCAPNGLGSSRLRARHETRTHSQVGRAGRFMRPSRHRITRRRPGNAPVPQDVSRDRQVIRADVGTISPTPSATCTRSSTMQVAARAARISTTAGTVASGSRPGRTPVMTCNRPSDTEPFLRRHDPDQVLTVGGASSPPLGPLARTPAICPHSNQTPAPPGQAIGRGAEVAAAVAVPAVIFSLASVLEKGRTAFSTASSSSSW